MLRVEERIGKRDSANINALRDSVILARETCRSEISTSEIEVYNGYDEDKNSFLMFFVRPFIHSVVWLMAFLNRFVIVDYVFNALFLIQLLGRLADDAWSGIEEFAFDKTFVGIYFCSWWFILFFCFISPHRL